MKIIETFLSIQGEGINSGLPTFFIRLAGCNLRCSYCDTKYSYSGGHEMSVEDVVSEVISKSMGFKLVCITGGEPLINEETGKLIDNLIEKKYKVDVETNGSVLINKFPNSKNILYSLDIKCPSSNMSEKMEIGNLGLLRKEDQVKFIVADYNDFIYAKEITIEHNLIERTNVIFSPIGGVDADNLVKWILKEKLNVRIGLQIHKVIWKLEKDELMLSNSE